MSRPPLRCVLLLDGPIVPWWLARGLERCLKNGSLEIVAALINEGAPEPAGSRWSRYWANRRLLLGNLLLRIDRTRRARTGTLPDRPLEELAPDCLQLPVVPKRGKFTDEVPAEPLAELARIGVDLIVREGFRILKGDVLTAAPMGILSFHHGDNRVNRGGPTGVWEVLQGEETSGLTLQIMSAELDGGTVLARSIGRTEAWSIEANRRAIFARSPVVLERTVRRLWLGASGVHGSALEDPAWSGFERGILRFPETKAVLAGVGEMARRRLRHQRLWSRRTHQWCIAWHFAKNDTGGVPHPSLRHYRVWPSPPGIFRADPFPVHDASGRHWVFFEEFDYRVRRGFLRVVEWGQSGPIGDPRTVLEEDYHLSYPNVFRYEDEWWMLPEAAAGGHVDLYRATNFPCEWERHTRLLEHVPLIDPTLLQHEGKWHLFGNLVDEGISPDDELHLFTANRMTGPFHQHPSSPVVTDVRNARMAGRCFRVGDEIYRPAQVGAPRYGSGIAIRRIAALDSTRYREHETQCLMPLWDRKAVGFHTINAAGHLSTIDLRRLVPRSVGQP